MGREQLHLPPPFEELMRRHEQEIMRFLLRATGDREDAGDLFQETWLRAYRAYPRLAPDADARPWLYAIAANLWRNRARDRARRARVIVAQMPEHLAPARTKSGRAAHENDGYAAIHLRQLISALPRKQREALYLRYFAGLDYAEIGAAMQCSAQAARANVSQAARKLKAGPVGPMKIQAAIDSVGRQFGDDQVEELLRAARRGFNQAFDLIRRPQAALGVVKSPLGDLLVAASSRGVVLNHYVRDGADLAATIGRLRLYFDPVDDRSTAEEIGQEVRGYLAGDAKALRHKVDLTLAQSEFQKMVLAKLRAVPRGAVLSYRALSAVTGSPNAARAVGNALHNNPVPVYVPCHRVIAHDGGIGGYGGGLPSKLQLLRAEGFTVDNTGARISDHTVWGNKGTRIYCRPQCRTTARVDRTHVLFFADSKQAQRAGMRPCKLCRPS